MYEIAFSSPPLFAAGFSTGKVTIDVDPVGSNFWVTSPLRAFVRALTIFVPWRGSIRPLSFHCRSRDIQSKPR